MLAALRFLFLKNILDKNKILCELHTAVKINSFEGVDVHLKVDLFPTIFFFREIKKKKKIKQNDRETQIYTTHDTLC